MSHSGASGDSKATFNVTTSSSAQTSQSADQGTPDRSIGANHGPGSRTFRDAVSDRMTNIDMTSEVGNRTGYSTPAVVDFPMQPYNPVFHYVGAGPQGTHPSGDDSAVPTSTSSSWLVPTAMTLQAYNPDSQSQQPTSTSTIEVPHSSIPLLYQSPPGLEASNMLEDRRDGPHKTRAVSGRPPLGLPIMDLGRIFQWQ